MIDFEDLKQQVYCAMPPGRISTERLAKQLCMERGRLAFILKLLRLDGRVESLGRHYDRSVQNDRSVQTLRAYWRRK